MQNRFLRLYYDYVIIRTTLCANAYICLIWRVIKLHMLIRLSVTIYLIPIFFRQNDEV